MATKSILFISLHGLKKDPLGGLTMRSNYKLSENIINIINLKI